MLRLKLLDLIKALAPLAHTSHNCALKAGQFFQDDYGKSSAMRLAMVAVVGLILGVWSYCCVVNKEFIDIGPGTSAILMAVILGKAYESKHEYKPHERLAHSKGLKPTSPTYEDLKSPSLRDLDPDSSEAKHV